MILLYSDTVVKAKGDTSSQWLMAVADLVGLFLVRGQERRVAEGYEGCGVWGGCPSREKNEILLLKFCIIVYSEKSHLWKYHVYNCMQRT